MSEYHIPVLLKECIDALNLKPDGVYIDVTFGGGGHTMAILEQIPEGKLYAFDQDNDAIENTKDIDHPGFKLISANFRYLQKYLKLYGVKKVDGILADFGVSSHQFDTADRGFSIRFDASLDMRMNQQSTLTAKQIINTYTQDDLHKIFGMYGEVRNAKTLASAIVMHRQKSPINTIEELKKILQSLVPARNSYKYMAQVFQALRIEVNDELKALEELLVQIPDVLHPEGRFVALTYHSLEDRLVKNFIQKGKFHGELEKDFYGNVIKPMAAINRKPLTANAEEIAENPRARSAKMRVATIDETKPRV